MDPEPPDETAPLLIAAPRPRLRIAVGAAIVLVLVGLGATVVASMLAPRGGVVAASGAPLTVDAGPSAGTIVVHVLGAVAEPGVYQLRGGARVLDAIAAAGGFADDAARDGVNLAAALSDGQQLVVPVAGAAPPPAAGAEGDGLVNLNTADEATLETLPRVGPAMAQRIIAFRETNGGFRSVQDLLGVSGIGEKTFAALQPLVTV